ncbi:MAG: TonB family protein [Alphaproteobacteria bacterium]|nr:TonB family protein [Alphaproteobacteria bacterium]
MMFRWLIVVAAATMAAGSAPVWSQEGSAPAAGSAAPASAEVAPADNGSSDSAPSAQAAPTPGPEEPQQAEKQAGTGSGAGKVEDSPGKVEDSPEKVEDRPAKAGESPAKSDTSSKQTEDGDPPSVATSNSEPARGAGGSIEGIRQTLQTPQAVTLQTPDAPAGHDLDPVSVWGRKISTYLAQHLRYPKGRTESQPVMVGVRLVVTPRGEVVTARIMKSSGDAQFDEAALDMVRRSNPLPPAPRSVTLEGSSFNVPVVFRPIGPVPSVSPIGNALALDLPVVADSVCDRTFDRLRAEAATRSLAIQTAIAVERTHPALPPQRCRLFGDFAQTQLRILRFLQTNSARCGIAAEQVWRVMEAYRDIQGLQIQTCNAGSGQASSGRDGYAVAYSTPISDDNGFDIAYGITAYRPSHSHRIGHIVSDSGHFPNGDVAMRDGVAAPAVEDVSPADVPTGAVSPDAAAAGGDSPAQGSPAEPARPETPTATVSTTVSPGTPAAQSDTNAASHTPAATAPASSTSAVTPAAPASRAGALPHPAAEPATRAGSHRTPRGNPAAAGARAGSSPPGPARPAHARNPDRGGPYRDDARSSPPSVFTWGSLPFWAPSNPPANPPRPAAATPSRNVQPAPQPAPPQSTYRWGSSEGTYRWGSGPGPTPSD